MVSTHVGYLRDRSGNTLESPGFSYGEDVKSANQVFISLDALRRLALYSVSFPAAILAARADEIPKALPISDHRHRCARNSRIASLRNIASSLRRSSERRTAWRALSRGGRLPIASRRSCSGLEREDETDEAPVRLMRLLAHCLHKNCM